jgi:hypothetical protein
VFDDDRAPTATPLTATRHVDLDAGFACGIGNQRAVFDLDGRISWFKVDLLGSDKKLLLKFGSCSSSCLEFYSQRMNPVTANFSRLSEGS